jgi:hypothetical protein
LADTWCKDTKKFGINERKLEKSFGIFGKRNKEMRELPNIIEFIPSSQPPALSLKVKKRCPRAPF